jgi:hypothetical protein
MSQPNLSEIWREPPPVAIEEAAFRAAAQLYPVVAAQPRRSLIKRVKLRAITIDSGLFRPFRVC